MLVGIEAIVGQGVVASDRWLVAASFGKSKIFVVCRVTLVIPSCPIRLWS